MRTVEPVRVGFTGHRPKDLDIDEHAFHHLLYETINDPDSEPTDYTFITGGALGIDTWAASYAVINNLPLIIVLPFPVDVMTKFWTPQDARTLRLQTHYAERVEVIHTGPYHPQYYQRRNERMVNLSDVMWAYWSGKRFGGTWNCIQYAIAQGNPPWNLRTKEWIR